MSISHEPGPPAESQWLPPETPGPRAIDALGQILDEESYHFEPIKFEQLQALRGLQRYLSERQQALTVIQRAPDIVADDLSPATRNFTDALRIGMRAEHEYTAYREGRPIESVQSLAFVDSELPDPYQLYHQPDLALIRSFADDEKPAIAMGVEPDIVSTVLFATVRPESILLGYVNLMTQYRSQLSIGNDGHIT